MLRTLRIRDLVIIDDLTLHFDPGFNVLTGETGAGKSILLDALGLATGRRADRSLVRRGTKRAIVEALFDLSEMPDLTALAEERGIELDEGQLLVRREVAAEGTHRILLNGSPQTLSPLREMGEALLAIHGQHDSRALIVPEEQLRLLDRFAIPAALIESVRETCERVQDLEQERDELIAAESGREEELDRLQRLVEEIESFDPQPGEIQRLENERRMLQNAGRVRSLIEAVMAQCYDGEPSAVGLAAKASRECGELADLVPELGELSDRLSAAVVELDDVGATLRDWRDRSDFDPARLEQIEQRRADLDRLLLRHGPDEAALLETVAQAQDRIGKLADRDGSLSELEVAIGAAAADYGVQAKELTRRRQEGSKKLARAIEKQMKPLAMADARFKVALSPANGRTVFCNGETLPLSPHGAERARFELAANKGESFGPVAKAASGGELSRLMLALHVVVRGLALGAVHVFDEVDAGIGGAVAEAVGARLAKLAGEGQVLCVTHAPQLAAYADHHVTIRKMTEKRRTVVRAEVVDNDGRVTELARMLDGRADSEISRKHAAALLEAVGRNP